MSYRFAVDLACIGGQPLPANTLARINEAIVLGLALANYETMAVMGITPLYESGVRYRFEKRGETWRDYCSTLAAGFGNCKEFVAWRLAELWHQGYDAAPLSIVQDLGRGSILFHVVVRHSDGSIEDPSKALGMVA